MTVQRFELDYARVEKAIAFVRDSFRQQPTLDEVADHLGMSSYHVQRLFKRWAGVSPKRFLQFVTLQHAKALLKDSGSVLDASYGAGLSGPGRLHDLFVGIEAVTPGEFRSGGEGIDLRWGIHGTPFGDAFFAATGRGLTSLHFLAAEDIDAPLATLRESWPKATLTRSEETTRLLADRIFGPPERRRSILTSPAFQPESDPGPLLRLHVRGTNFQLRVWEALLRIPAGGAVTYGDVAKAIGEPHAARAVGQAVGRNPIAVIIPCHRVLRSGGEFGGYQWGAERKRAVLAWEAVRSREQGGTWQQASTPPPERRKQESGGEA